MCRPAVARGINFWGTPLTEQHYPYPKTAEVISLWHHKQQRDSSALSEMRSYWESLRSGRLVPLRSEIDPREITDALEFGFILERIQPGAVRFRLAGMHLSDLMGMEVSGMPLRAFINTDGRDRFSTMLERVFTQPEIHEYHLASADARGTDLHARLLVMPLKSDGGTVDRAIGCLVSKGVVGLAPRRFRVLETRVTSLTAGATTAEDNAQPAPRVAGLAEPQTKFASRPVLRLVKTDAP